MAAPSLSLSSIALLFLLTFSRFIPFTLPFQSDELLANDDEFGLEGGSPAQPVPDHRPVFNTPLPPTTMDSSTTRRRSLDSDSDSKLEFIVEHAFGDSKFVAAGTFSARLKSWSHGPQTLTKLRFSRNTLTDAEKEKFKELLLQDDFYTIRFPSNVLSPPGRNYTYSTVKARCIAQEALDEHFIIHMDGIHVLAVNYGSPGACSYPRPLKVPSKWSFSSHTVLKYSEQAPRTPVFVEEVLGEIVEDEGMNSPAKSFVARYWMYLIPLGMVVVNAISQVMNLVPEEQVAGQPGSEVQQPGRGASAAARRR